MELHLIAPFARKVEQSIFKQYSLSKYKYFRQNDELFRTTVMNWEALG